jgi:hypothetical protein
MNVASTLESVTIYREGAICTRTCTITPAQADAPQRVRIVGLPLALGPASLRAAVRSGPPSLRVLDVRAAFDVELVGDIDLAAETRAFEAARDAHARLQLQLDRLESEIAELRGLGPRFLEPRRGDPPREAPVAAMLELATFVDARLAVRLERRRKLARELDDAASEEELRRRRLAEASSAKRTERAQVSRAAIITLSDKLVQPIALALEYQIAGVRWTPSYRLSLAEGGRSGRLAMRAAIAQSTGEDWSSVAIALSTASLARRTDLPELRSLRIGRAQPEPPRAGWREPPPGLDALFESYDGARAERSRENQARFARQMAKTATIETEDSATMRRTAVAAVGSTSGYGRPEGATRSVPPPAAAPMPARMSAPVAFGAPAPLAAQAPVQRQMRTRTVVHEDHVEVLEMEEEVAAAPAVAPRPDATALDYDRLCMTGPDSASAERGRLVAAPTWGFGVAIGVHVQVEIVIALLEEAQRRAGRLGHVPLPPDHVAVAPVDQFDYRYDCAVPLDVPSTGAWVTVPVMDCQVGLRPRHVCVPSVEPKVYRTLEIANDTVHALLPGPVDVSAGEQFLLTTMLPAVPPGARTKRLGLGVEESIKVARSTTYKETTGGLLGGSTVLPHEVIIEIDNRLPVPADLEVRERVPVVNADDKDIKLEEQQVYPPWEVVDEPLDGVLVHGTRRWRITIPARETTTLLAQFAIRIPADKMLVGGNRRN